MPLHADSSHIKKPLSLTPENPRRLNDEPNTTTTEYIGSACYIAFKLTPTHSTTATNTLQPLTFPKIVAATTLPTTAPSPILLFSLCPLTRHR